MYVSLIVGLNHINFGLCVNGRWYSFFRSRISPFNLEVAIWDNVYRQKNIPRPPRGSPGLEQRHLYIHRSHEGNLTLYIRLGR